MAELLGLDVAPHVAARAPREAVDALAGEEPVALALVQGPAPSELAALAQAAALRGMPVPVALPGGASELRHLAGDLGLPALEDVRALLAAVALVQAEIVRPWDASTRDLGAADRARLGALREDEGKKSRTRSDARWTREDGGLVGIAQAGRTALLGEPRDVGEACRALAQAAELRRPGMPTVEDVDEQAVLDVILGPPRALSDPASKAALASYDLPLPDEELCTSPSRAAAEASRIGFPVRIALASPDLRVWDHPDLAADGVDNAARVREVFRQITTLAQERAPNARLLGVTVSASTEAVALLRVRIEPLGRDLVLAQLGFADAHGAAAQDRTWTVLPATHEGLERVLNRLRGHALLLRGSAAERRHVVTSIGDTLLRLAAFAHEWRTEIAGVEIDPLAVLVGGDAEVREACIRVSDAFQRTLEASPIGG